MGDPRPIVVEVADGRCRANPPNETPISSPTPSRPGDRSDEDAPVVVHDSGSFQRFRRVPIRQVQHHAQYNSAMPITTHCDLDHERPRAAIVRVQLKSTRVGKPGHPMTRELALCATHARELRALGLDVVG
jgi:hypothetical protein